MKTYITETIYGEYSDIRVKANSWEEAEAILRASGRKDVIIIGEFIDEI